MILDYLTYITASALLQYIILGHEMERYDGKIHTDDR